MDKTDEQPVSIATPDNTTLVERTFRERAW